MNRELIQYIMQRMAEWLDNRQMIVLQNTLDESMKMTESRQKTKSSEELLTEFIDTTLHYAMVKQSNVKSAHRKYIG